MSSVVRVDEIVGLNREVNESAGSEIRPHRETRGQRQQDTVPGDDGTVKGLGSAQIVLGMSLVFFGGFLFTDLSMAASTATPWWTGLTLIIAGSLTVSSDNRKTNAELVKAAFGLNIVSCILIGFSVLILSFDIAVTVIFALIYRSWILSFLMKMVFLVFLVAALGISVTVLVNQSKRIPPRGKCGISVRSVKVRESGCNPIDLSLPLE